MTLHDAIQTADTNGILDIVMSENLEGQKKAVRLGSKIFLSPAMFDLFKKEQGTNSFNHLIKNIEIKEFKIGVNKVAL